MFARQSICKGGRAAPGGENTASSFLSSTSRSSNPPPRRRHRPPQRNGPAATVEEPGARGTVAEEATWGALCRRPSPGRAAGGRGGEPRPPFPFLLLLFLTPLLVVIVVVVQGGYAAVRGGGGCAWTGPATGGGPIAKEGHRQTGTAVRAGQDRPREADPRRRRGAPGTRWRW